MCLRYVYIILFLIGIVGWLLIEFIYENYGQWDNCQVLRIGQSKIMIDLHNNIYSHTHGGWHMECPCEEGIIYYLHFRRPFLLQRLDTLEIIKQIEENSPVEILDAREFMSKYGFTEVEIPFFNNSDTTIIEAKEDVKFTYTHRKNRKDIITIRIW